MKGISKAMERDILANPANKVGPSAILPGASRDAPFRHPYPVPGTVHPELESAPASQASRIAQDASGGASGISGAVHVAWLPGHRPSLINPSIRKHWAARSRNNKAECAVIQAAVIICGIPMAERKRKVELYIHLGPGQKRSDDDAPFKVLLDGLVKAGALVNDSPKWCHVERPMYARCIDGAVPGTMIVLTDIGG